MEHLKKTEEEVGRGRERMWETREGEVEVGFEPFRQIYSFPSLQIIFSFNTYSLLNFSSVAV